MFLVGNNSFRILFHENTTGWTSPTWNGYPSACIDRDLSDCGTLDAENRNAQRLLFTLNDSAMTATVGDGSWVRNNAGYVGEGGGTAIIPDTVTKDGESYRVVGIGQHAFDECTALKTIELGANVTSVGEGAFWNCGNFTAFTVAAGNQNYSAPDGVLYDKMQYQLYVYPSGRPGASYDIPAITDRISQYAFYGAANLAELTVPDTVLDIGREAFWNCSALTALTLPFIGGSRGDTESFYYVYGSDYRNESSCLLRSVTVTQEALKGSDFSNCQYLTDITILAEVTEIPYGAFRGCTGLVRLSLNGAGAEAGTAAISAGISQIGYNAFYRCTSLACFDVAEDNPNYCSDRWGVLFTKDKSRLIAYPASRKWPYYNVPEETVTIIGGAFYNCQNLVNLFIPQTVTDMGSGSVENCPNTTVCVYRNSPAAQYTASNNLNSWYIDNYTMQGIEVYSLPEQTTFATGQVDFTGLYLAANYGGRQLQLDDYTLEYDPNRAGTQTVVVRAKENSTLQTSFQITITPKDGRALTFDVSPTTVPCTGLVALYQNGKLTALHTPEISNEKATLVLKEADYQAADRITLFLLGADHTPAAPAVDYKKT